MRMSGWAFFFFALLLIVSFLLLIYDAVRRQHELKMMERMRRSRMYYEVYGLVKYARKHDIDKIRIERTRIIFYAVNPAGKMGDFVLEDWGYRPMTPAQVRALTLVLAEDLAPLQERKWYRLSRYTVVRPNGIKDDAYQYTIKPQYKTLLVAQRKRVYLH